jgi:hypothetical protein
MLSKSISLFDALITIIRRLLLMIQGLYEAGWKILSALNTMAMKSVSPSFLESNSYNRKIASSVSRLAKISFLHDEKESAEAS